MKCHYELPEFKDNLVALHSFNGGYGGLSKTEEGLVNFCYLTTYKSFKQEKSIEAFNKNVVAKNPRLKQFFSTAIPVFKNPSVFLKFHLNQNKVLKII